jgi:hypothetical protein
VVAKRTELGIASVTGAAASSAFDWCDEAVALLGTASDAKIAEQLGLSRLTVYNARIARGIAAAGRGRARAASHEPAGAPVTEPGPTRPQTLLRAVLLGWLWLAALAGFSHLLTRLPPWGWLLAVLLLVLLPAWGHWLLLMLRKKLLRLQFAPQGHIGRWLAAAGGRPARHWRWPCCCAPAHSGRPGFWRPGNGRCWRWLPCFMSCWPVACRRA